MINRRYILMGPPGVGKGTQAAMLAKKLNVPHISTGEIFRENFKNKTELGNLAKSYIDKGMLVPDSVTNDIVAKRLEEKDCQNGFILDGYPRNKDQAKFLEKFLKDHKLKLEAAINFKTEDDEIIKRLSGRRVCPKCSKIYHIITQKPKKEETCDDCQVSLTKRKDDDEKVIKQRLVVYNKTAFDLIKYYREKELILEIDASKDQLTILNDLLEKLKSL